VRKIVLAGTGPAGGDGIVNVGAVLQDAFGKAGATNKHPKHFLFFTQTSNGQTAADNFLQRLKERTKDLDAPVSNETVQAQIAAIQAWGQGDATTLGTVQHPVLVVNGDDDVMVPSFKLIRARPQAAECTLSIFPDAGTAASSSTMPPSFSRHSPSSSNKQSWLQGPAHRLRRTMSLPNAASGIALSEADMDAREMILGSANPISLTHLYFNGNQTVRS